MPKNIIGDDMTEKIYNRLFEITKDPDTNCNTYDCDKCSLGGIINCQVAHMTNFSFSSKTEFNKQLEIIRKKAKSKLAEMMP